MRTNAFCFLCCVIARQLGVNFSTLWLTHQLEALTKSAVAIPLKYSYARKTFKYQTEISIYEYLSMKVELNSIYCIILIVLNI